MTQADSLQASVRERSVRSVDAMAITEGVRSPIGGDSSGHDIDHTRCVFLLGARIAARTRPDAALYQDAALTDDLH